MTNLSPQARQVLERIDKRLSDFDVNFPEYYEEQNRIFRELLLLVERQREALIRECCCPGERSHVAPYDFIKCDACEFVGLTDESLRKLGGGE